jgi:hypothetical protein
MNLRMEQFLTWQELAQLPSSDPRRREFEERLSVFPAAERAYWIELLAESDRNYASLAGSQLEAIVQQQLLDIPNTHPSVSLWQRVFGGQVGWVRYAAAIVLVVGIVRIAMWAIQPAYEPQVPQLNQQLADNISQMAVAHESTPMLVESSDPTTVANGLMKQNLPFTPAVLQPTTPLNLRGGGVFNYQSIPVAFTRWSGNGVNYTLYQFDPQSLGVPPQFIKMVDNVSPAQRVVLWAGAKGACTWALVLENQKAINPFSTTYTY